MQSADGADRVSIQEFEVATWLPQCRLSKEPVTKGHGLTLKAVCVFKALARLKEEHDTDVTNGAFNAPREDGDAVQTATIAWVMRLGLRWQPHVSTLRIDVFNPT